MQKSKALYSHPFSRSYWRDAAAELKDTRILVIAALLTALRIALKPLAIPIAPQLSIQTATLATALGAMLFGPVVAIPAAVISDTVGFLLFPTGDYFLPYILTEIGSTVLYALCLYRSKPSAARVMLSRFLICFGVNILLQQMIMAWQYAYMGNPEKAKAQILGIMGIARLLKNLAFFPVESVVLTLFLRAILPVTNRMGLTCTEGDVRHSMRFSAVQICTLALLMVLGGVGGYHYLGYYYDNTNLIVNSSTDYRYRANTAAADAVAQTIPREGTVVAVVTKANKKFLDSRMHYTAICYRVNSPKLADYEIAGCRTEEEKLEAIRAMSKTPAGKAEQAGALEALGTYAVTVDEKTGAVIECTLQE